jgi:hypothetical protein
MTRAGASPNASLAAAWTSAAVSGPARPGSTLLMSARVPVDYHRAVTGGDFWPEERLEEEPALPSTAAALPRHGLAAALAAPPPRRPLRRGAG